MSYVYSRDYDDFDNTLAYSYTGIGPTDCRHDLTPEPSVSAGSAGSKDSGYESAPLSTEFGDEGLLSGSANWVNALTSNARQVQGKKAVK